jgi:hypothetical protein
MRSQPGEVFIPIVVPLAIPGVGDDTGMAFDCRADLVPLFSLEKAEKVLWHHTQEQRHLADTDQGVSVHDHLVEHVDHNTDAASVAGVTFIERPDLAR